MNEWIDCVVFCLQAAAMWIALPRWCARFTRPMLMDRNPEWTEANPDIVAMRDLDSVDTGPVQRPRDLVVGRLAA